MDAATEAFEQFKKRLDRDELLKKYPDLAILITVAFRAGFNSRNDEIRKLKDNARIQEI